VIYEIIDENFLRINKRSSKTKCQTRTFCMCDAYDMQKDGFWREMHAKLLLKIMNRESYNKSI